MKLNSANLFLILALLSTSCNKRNSRSIDSHPVDPADLTKIDDASKSEVEKSEEIDPFHFPIPLDVVVDRLPPAASASSDYIIEPALKEALDKAQAEAHTAWSVNNIQVFYSDFRASQETVDTLVILKSLSGDADLLAQLKRHRLRMIRVSPNLTHIPIIGVGPGYHLNWKAGESKIDVLAAFASEEFRNRALWMDQLISFKINLSIYAQAERNAVVKASREALANPEFMQEVKRLNIGAIFASELSSLFQDFTYVTNNGRRLITWRIGRSTESQLYWMKSLSEADDTQKPVPHTSPDDAASEAESEKAKVGAVRIWKDHSVNLSAAPQIGYKNTLAAYTVLKAAAFNSEIRSELQRLKVTQIKIGLSQGFDPSHDGGATVTLQFHHTEGQFLNFLKSLSVTN